MTILFDSLTKSKLRQIYHDNFIFRFLYLKKKTQNSSREFITMVGDIEIHQKNKQLIQQIYEKGLKPSSNRKRNLHYEKLSINILKM